MNHDDNTDRCRHRGATPLPMSYTLPVCWRPKGHDGDHATCWGAIITDGGNDE